MNGPPAFTYRDMTASLRDQLVHGQHAVLGTFVKLPSTEVVDLVALAGFDLMVVDLEHSQLSEADARQLVRHAFAIGLPAVVRLPEVARGTINRLLESGAAGIQVSMITRREQVDQLVAYTRFPPGGSRSISLTSVAAGYGSMPMADYLSGVAAGPLLVGQIETAATTDPLDDLLGNLDVAFCGTTDLSVDLGEPGRTDGPAVTARIEEVAQAVHRTPGHVVFGGFGVGQTGVDRLRSAGARYLVVGSDLGVLGAALQSLRPDQATSTSRAGEPDPSHGGC